MVARSSRTADDATQSSVMTLALRRIVWSDGTSRPDDYNIIHGDQIVGRMYRMNEPSSRTHAARKCPLASLECHKGAIGRPAAAEMEGGRKHAY